ncbi:MAG: hypothetical protein H6863_03745 [Rhodospirillales bacterium]|nr:hypothetical protein [Rhodospirillales bacterium]
MLNENAFFILDISTRDNKEAIAEAFDEKAADGDYEEAVLHQAQRALMASKTRLEAELSWFPDVAPKKAKAISEKIGSDFKKGTVKFFKDSLNELDGISKANLAAYVCMAKEGDVDFIKAIIDAQSDISAETAQANINANRKVAGFPDVDESLVSQQLEKLRQQWAEAAIQQISQSEHPGNYMTELLNSFSENEDQSSKRFLDNLMERYESFIVPILRNHEDTIDSIMEEIKEGDGENEDDVDKLIRELELWDEYAQPSQLVYCQKGLDEPRSKKIYDKVRDFSIWLANDAHQHQLSLKISKAAKEIFAELPFVLNRIQEDINTLETLVADAEMEEVVAPLFEPVLLIFKDDKAFIKALRKKEFSEESPGVAGEVFRAFQAVRKETDGTSHAAMPWEMLRRLAIHLNNESENPEAAMKILKKLQAMSPPDDISGQIDDDIHTMEENILGRDLRVAMEAKNLSQAKSLLKQIIEHCKTEEDKKQWRILLYQIENKKKQLPWGWIFWIVIIFGSIGLDECSGPSGSSSSSSSYSSSSYQSSSEKLETKPPYNSTGALSTNELRWCLYQGERLDFIQKQFPTSEYDYNEVSLHNARLITQNTSDQYDALISEYNSRCYNASYYENAERTVKRELGEYATQQKLKESAKNIMRSWNANFYFKE